MADTRGVPERWAKTTEPCPKSDQVPTNVQQVLRTGSDSEAIRERFHHPNGVCERLQQGRRSALGHRAA